MRVVVAIDSFKGSLTTLQAGNAAARGIKRVFDSAIVSVCPLADGGEGTLNALLYEDETDLQKVKVCNPLGQRINAHYGIIDDEGTAVIEIAAAAGITLIKEEEKNPMNTTTYGVGELIKDAVAKGCRNFIIGIGGSATNDCGIGMLQALGFDFLDADGKPVEFGAKGLYNIKSISIKNTLPELAVCSFHVACDVKNVLCGAQGCSAVYGAQKGATLHMIRQMDNWLRKFAVLTRSILKTDYSNYPGSGAAGGLGFAFLTYLNATLEPGIDLIIRETHLEDYIRNADIVITGEGRLDGQTCMGKAPAGVAAIAKKYNVPVIAFSGCVADGARQCNENGIDAFFPILRNPGTFEEAMEVKNACQNMSDTVEQVFKLIKSVSKNE